MVEDANVPAWKTSLKNVMKKYKDIAYVVSGHFGWTDQHSLKHTLKLIRKSRHK